MTIAGERSVLQEWHNQTTLHPLGLTALLLLACSALLVPRRFVIVPILVMACFIAPAQRMVVFSLDFSLLRILLLVVWARVLVKGEFRHMRWTPLDWLVITWASVSALVMIACHGTMWATVNRTGFMLDSLGTYLIFRVLIRDWRDVRCIAMAVGLLSVPVAAVFMIEKSTGHNVFAVFGGLPEITLVRAGKLRCTGAFAHPILAGSFWVALLPLAGLLWFDRRRRWLAPAAIVAIVTIVLACASSTPLLAMIAAALLALVFTIRRWAGVLVGAGVVGLGVLQLGMQNPIWHLLLRINLVEGSTGFHRFLLIDEFVRHMDEWWLVGVTSTEHWNALSLEDITNQYVLEGIRGGLPGLLLFLAVIAVAFQQLVVLSRRAERAARPVRDPLVRASWALGMMLCLHCLIFIGTSYFGQIVVIWQLTLALVGSLAAQPLPSERTRPAVIRTRAPSAVWAGHPI